MSNFVPNEDKTICLWEPEWMNGNMKNYQGIRIKSLKGTKEMDIKMIRLWNVLRLKARKQL